MHNLEQLYQQIILDAARERYGSGSLDTPDGESFQVNPTCGDEVLMQVCLDESGQRFTQVAWSGQGCSISQASTGILTGLVEDGDLVRFEEIFQAFRAMMDNRGQEITQDTADLLEDAAALQGVSKFPARIKCALLGWMALREAAEKAQADKEEN